MTHFYDILLKDIPHLPGSRSRCWGVRGTIRFLADTWMTYLLAVMATTTSKVVMGVIRYGGVMA